MSENRIKSALFLDGWNYESGNKDHLRRNATSIIAKEFDISMKDKIFCPICSTPLTRKPLVEDFFTNGREAFFSHLPSYREVDCRLRVPKPEGQLYETEEEAREAIENKQLAIIHKFKSEPPVENDSESEEYDQTAVEDEDGPVSAIPITRHTGETLNLPTKITTVAGICRKFDENYYKYFYMPNSNVAILLNELLHNVEDVIEEDDEPKLYFGVIRSSHVAGAGSDSNVRMTRLVSNPAIKDFYLKDLNGVQKKHGINDNSAGRIVLFWGRITVNGIGLCVENLEWGEYGLLPEKYNSILLN
ncbi:TPA: hypothetical protein OVL15_003490 [Acinetobacter baumannii]|uniref:hypothetical protein n=1 Tax=Acinetobacter baumannii TaxID=470 RepID=UPI0019D288D9|nr:hypothetical protein [Acinetobacter baumannii]HCT1790619.1 hypothetical protein [Acinetobacter baumannii]HCT9560616.1 hypothetical protein [Acinetobacter baumannii]HCT9573255.1 hypothetical protein [Acinetobacter baumannii]HCT9576886.1 hypothetical protein [Acinetobacter baumannii]HCU8695564.1 hypothetical protein [Acinetobacter baumannii]